MLDDWNKNFHPLFVESFDHYLEIKIEGVDTTVTGHTNPEKLTHLSCVAPPVMGNEGLIVIVLIGISHVNM